MNKEVRYTVEPSTSSVVNTWTVENQHCQPCQEYFIKEILKMQKEIISLREIVNKIQTGLAVQTMDKESNFIFPYT